MEMVQRWEDTSYFEGKGKKKSNTAVRLCDSNTGVRLHDSKIVKTAEYQTVTEKEEEIKRLSETFNCVVQKEAADITIMAVYTLCTLCSALPSGKKSHTIQPLFNLMSVFS